MSKNGMSANKSPKSRTQKSDEDKRYDISTVVTKVEFEYLKAMASLLSKFQFNGSPFIKENTVSELVRGCLGSTCNMYQYNVFPDSRIVNMLPDKESVKEFIAFRKKYMNIPIDVQLEDLKRLGIVKHKQET